MQIFDKNNDDSDIYILKNEIVSITYAQGITASLTNVDGNTISLGCLQCHNKRCCFFSKEEIEVSDLSDFPFDYVRNVCPVDALQADLNTGKISIENDKCLKCGLCAKRCPVGALFFDQKGNLKINFSTDNLIKTKKTASSINLQKSQIQRLLHVKRNGTVINESENLFKEIYEKLNNIDSKKHDLIGRNLLIGLSCYSGKRRIGDVYTRMDAVYQTLAGTFGAVEVEFGKDTLDASRAILDDVATLKVRYQIDKELNHPLVICLQLPNARQGYWQVIKDVKTVENIEIQTLSIGAMMVLLWNNCSVKLDECLYYIDFDNKSLRGAIEKQVGRPIKINDKYLGILEPSK